MDVMATALADVKIITPPKFGDHRGFFSETYHKAKLAEAGVDLEFVQDNQSLSTTRGVLRGLHYQLPPLAQDKLVRVTRGAILDVAVDIRRGSATFGQHVAVELSAENWRQLLVPIGFAHGFVTLTDETEVCYKCSDFYSPEHERGIAFDDPDLGIEWPLAAGELTLSERDRQHPRLKDQADVFD
jgi:dTDP-4-dehydrorhamnose 3,5-epimerase